MNPNIKIRAEILRNPSLPNLIISEKGASFQPPPLNPVVNYHFFFKKRLAKYFRMGSSYHFKHK